MRTRTAIRGAILAGGALAAASATVVPAASATPAAAPAASAAAEGESLAFYKGDTATTGQVIWTSGTGTQLSWRAGSGTGANWNNSCIRNQGNLPSGQYRIVAWHDNYPGSLIHGRAIQLEDKACSNGTLRTELFVHSEQTVNNTQGTTEGTRWDGDSDYYSEGCIKMNPDDLQVLYKESATGQRPPIVSVKD